MPLIRRTSLITGNRLRFRDVTVEDADFIVRLRTAEGKSAHINQTSPDVSQQVKYIESYHGSSDSAYFIICDDMDRPLGTVRLYDPNGRSFCWGSWILKEGSPSAAGIESALIVYSYALDHLGFSAAHFGVRRGNERVWRFHERFGATRIREDNDEYHYSIDEVVIRHSIERYRRYLPDGIQVTFVS